MKLKDGYCLFRQATADFVRDDAMTLGAGLAFYTALSIAPLLLLLMWILSLFGHRDQQELIGQVYIVMGAEAGKSVAGILESAAEWRTSGTAAGIFGILMLLFSASAAFGQLQHALNLIWNVELDPGLGVGRWIRNRLLSMGMVLTIGFLLIVSLALSAAVSAVTNSPSPEERGLWLRAFDLLAPTVAYALLFGMIYRVLPDAKIAWRDVAVGGVVTALLFTIGKSLIGLYLGRSSTASAYGAAGSLVVLLLWVYYSSLIVFFGAELTQAWSRLFGRGIRPTSDAKRRTEAIGTDKPAKVNPQTA